MHREFDGKFSHLALETVQYFPEIFSVDPFHRDEQTSVYLAIIIGLNHVRMIEAHRDFDFRPEHPQIVRVAAKMILNALDDLNPGDSVVRRQAGAENRSHPAFCQLVEQQVASKLLQYRVFRWFRLLGGTGIILHPTKGLSRAFRNRGPPT